MPTVVTTTAEKRRIRTRSNSHMVTVAAAVMAGEQVVVTVKVTVTVLVVVVVLKPKKSSGKITTNVDTAGTIATSIASLHTSTKPNNQTWCQLFNFPFPYFVPCPFLILHSALSVLRACLRLPSSTSVP